MLQSIFYLNEKGRRENIEDSIFPPPNQAGLTDSLFLVCDGVGGESKGEEASRIICEAIPEYFAKDKLPVINSAFLQKAADFANEKLKAYGTIHPVAARMSSTLALGWLEKNKIAIAWCGDSRIYHIREGKVLWQSTDHSLVMELVKRGEITKEEAMAHPQKNTIMRSLSAAEGNHTIDTYFIDNYRTGDYLLLCTDGVLEQIDEIAIHDILGPQEANQNKQELFLAYCLGKTNDNFSLYLLGISETARPPDNHVNKTSTGKSKKKPIPIIIIGLIIIAGLLFIVKNYEEKINETHQPPAATPFSNPSNQPPLPVSPDKKEIDKQQRQQTKSKENVSGKSTDSSLLKILKKSIKNN